MRPVNSIDELLEHMVTRDASDLHVTVGTPPVIRVRGEVERLDEYAPLTPDDTQELLYRILSSEQQKNFEIKRQLDFSHSIPGLARFRVNVYFQRESIGAAFRLIPAEIKTLEELGIPATLHQLAEKPRGLVLVTGPTGSGKSTTLAAIIDEINRNRSEHILTIEDPIEFLHRHKRCIVNQREIGPDATSFGEASACRASPGPRRDPRGRDARPRDDLHRADRRGDRPSGFRHPAHAERAVDDRPHHRRLPGRAAGADPNSDRQLAARRRDPGTDSDRRRNGEIPALEVLLPDDAVRNLIRQGKVEQVYSVMQTNTSRGMQTMEQSLADLIQRGVIDVRGQACTVPAGPAQLIGVLERAGFPVELPTDLSEPQTSSPARRRTTRRGELVMDDQSLWKKEVSFGRKPEEQTDADESPVLTRRRRPPSRRTLVQTRGALTFDGDAVAAAPADERR